MRGYHRGIWLREIKAIRAVTGTGGAVPGAIPGQSVIPAPRLRRCRWRREPCGAPAPPGKPRTMHGPARGRRPSRRPPCGLLRVAGQVGHAGCKDSEFQFQKQVCVRVLAARCARRDANSLPLEKQRAQGKPGARCTRGLACKCTKENAHEHTGSAEAIRPSLRNGFTAYSALAPVIGLSCHRHSHGYRARSNWIDAQPQKLDASVEASGPHDFAVRFSTVRQRHLHVHRNPSQRL